MPCRHDWAGNDAMAPVLQHKLSLSAVSRLRAKPGGPEGDSLHAQLEEAELAAAAAARRAHAAEAEAAALQQRVAAAEKRAAELSWQVRGTAPGCTWSACCPPVCSCQDMR